MNLNKLCVLLALCLFILFGCENSNSEKDNLSKVNFGKNLTITVSDKETIDAEYLKQVLEGKIKRNSPFFDLWDNQELKKMINYMAENNLILVAGEYTFNQAWKFDNGFLVLNNNEKREVFKFRQKDK